MSLSRIFRIVFCLLAILGLHLYLLEIRKHDNAIGYRFPADTLRCAIASDGMESTRKAVGFNYELLGAFGDNNGSYMRILPPQQADECWQKLMEDSLAIVVFNSKDSIPEGLRDSVLFSQPVKDDIVWAVSRRNTALNNAINYWYTRFQGESFFKEITRRYFRTYNSAYLRSMLAGGRVQSLSPYDDLVKLHAKRVGIDWRLLSAIIFQESQYNMDALSPMEAKGLMQVMDVTADSYGIPTDDLFDPDTNIKLGTMLFDDLIRDFRKEGLDSVNVIRFALASYNVGGGTLAKRRAETSEAGLNPDNWDDVAVIFRRYSNITPAYIEAVEQTFDLYKQIID